MTVDELADKLKEEYQNAPEGEKAASVVLFSIKYARELDKLNNNSAVARAANLTPPKNDWGTEIGYGRKLAKYVNLKGNTPY